MRWNLLYGRINCIDAACHIRYWSQIEKMRSCRKKNCRFFAVVAKLSDLNVGVAEMEGEEALTLFNGPIIVCSVCLSFAAGICVTV